MERVSDPEENATVVDATAVGVREIDALRRAFEWGGMEAISPKNRTRIETALDVASGDGPAYLRYEGRVYRVYFMVEE